MKTKILSLLLFILIAMELAASSFDIESYDISIKADKDGKLNIMAQTMMFG